MTDFLVSGGGLAGSEAAYQAAARGLKVRLYEMRPSMQTGAHQTHDLAELVCSNSLGSNPPPPPAIIASGPLTSPALSRSIAALSSEEHLFFFDAISPIVHADTINMEIAFRASRYGTGEQDEGDYINCPFTREEYYAFVQALLNAERIELRSFEDAIRNGVKAGHFFEGCL